MNRKLPLGIAPVLAVVALALPADARSESPPFADEVESCIAAVDAHLDLTDVQRVRHFVAEAKSTGLGYALTIRTSVLSKSDATESQYEAFCIAHGANEPSTFRIEAIGT